MAATARKARLFRQREQELLEAAAALYREEDWRGVTVERIAARAGIGKGTVYLHFRRKHEVAARLAVRFLKRLAGRWQAIPPRGERSARLRHLLAETRSVAEAQPGQLALVPAMLEPPLFGKLNAGIRAELLAALRALLAILYALLAGPPGGAPEGPAQATETVAAGSPIGSPAPPGWQEQAWLAWCVVQGALLAPAGLALGETAPETWLECAAQRWSRERFPRLESRAILL